MTLTRKLMLLGAIAALIQGCASPMTRPAPAAPAAPAATRPAVALHVPIEYYRLSNGLRVVLSPDHSVVVAGSPGPMLGRKRGAPRHRIELGRPVRHR